MVCRGFGGYHLSFGKFRRSFARYRHSGSQSPKLSFRARGIGDKLHHRIGIHGFKGAEIAGIKLHAALDTYIHHNRIHDTKRGMWLDWQAQGVRVSSNVFYNNLIDEDVYCEVTHGPMLVDNNIFASPFSFQMHAQGTAFVNNIFCGRLVRNPELNRYTPYHMPHSTAIMGCTKVYGGDDRYYNNIFLKTGTDIYNGMPESFEEYFDTVKSKREFSMPRFFNFTETLQPAYVCGNLYANGAFAYEKEKNGITVTDVVQLVITEESDEVWAKLVCDPDIPTLKTANSHELAPTRISEGLYESPSGENIYLDTDITGAKRSDITMPGAIESFNVKVRVF